MTAPWRAASNRRDTTWTSPAHPPDWKKRLAAAKTTNATNACCRPKATEHTTEPTTATSIRRLPPMTSPTVPMTNLADGVREGRDRRELTEARLVGHAVGDEERHRRLEVRPAQVEARVGDEQRDEDDNLAPAHAHEAGATITPRDGAGVTMRRASLLRQERSRASRPLPFPGMPSGERYDAR